MPTMTLNSFIELLGQTEEAYSKENNRLASYSDYNGNESAITLASKGFFYKQNGNEVECFCCHNRVPVVNLCHTSVLQLHLPNCEWDNPQHNEPSYIRTVDLKNERALEYIRIRAREINSLADGLRYPYNVNIAERIDRAVYNEPGSLDMAPVTECPCTQCPEPETKSCHLVLENGHITTTRAGIAKLAKQEQERISLNNQRSDNAMVAARIDTFDIMHDWPNQSAFQSKRNLAEAGFFYTGTRDNVQCFKCGGGLRNWDKRSDPWREHARWFPWCKYVRREMGDRFIHQILQITKKIRQSHEGREQTINADAVKNALTRGHTMDAISSQIQEFFSETGGHFRERKDTGILRKHKPPSRKQTIGSARVRLKPKLVTNAIIGKDAPETIVIKALCGFYPGYEVLKERLEK